jgi:UPF0755 protein
MQNGLKKILGLLGLFILGSSAYLYHQFWVKPLVLPVEGIEWVVSPGTSLRQLLTTLQQNPQLEPYSVRGFEWLVRIQGLQHQLKTGEYHFPQGSTGQQMLTKMVRGEVQQYAITLVEGWTFEQVLQALAMHPKLKHSLSGLPLPEMLNNLKLPYSHPEGLFFPDTYYFVSQTLDVAILNRALATMQQHLYALWGARSHVSVITSPYQALILASIIEKETALETEKAIMSGVFYNRLALNMPLQADPTVVYGLGADFKGPLKKVHLSQDGPYNTYTRRGLPPSPIALPSFSSLQAAIYPLPVEFKYFVAKGDGSHYFSIDLAAHNQAVRTFLLRPAL